MMQYRQLDGFVFTNKHNIVNVIFIVWVYFPVLSWSIASDYRNKLGHCEPLTEHFLTSLASRGARELFDPAWQNRPKILRYDLYTRRNPYRKQTLLTGDLETIRKSHFNSSWPIRFSLHGWNGKTTTCSNAAIKDAYLSVGDFNVILVDWSDYSLNINYLRVIGQILEIATKLNEFTRFIHRYSEIPYEKMYLIGHSAAAHIAGMAGKLLYPDRYGVIFGLDGSGPIHRDFNEKWRLSPHDAVYVESIQTDTALFGFPHANLGQASFFPNWGLGQPHCPNVTNMEPYYSCDHFSSIYYFSESILRQRAFGAIKCSNYDAILRQQCGCGEKQCPAEVFMGGEPATPKKGIFYLSTRPQRPFGYGTQCQMKLPIKPTLMRLNI